MLYFISTFRFRKYCTTLFVPQHITLPQNITYSKSTSQWTSLIVLLHSTLPQKKNTYFKSTSQWTYHIKSLAHFTFLMFSSCCRGTQTGNHRCKYQSHNHVNTNPNLHGTISPTTCTSIKYSTCEISNPRQTHDIIPQTSKGPSLRQPSTTPADSFTQKPQHLKILVNQAINTESYIPEGLNIKEIIGNLGLMWPLIYTTHHCEKIILQQFSTGGCPINCGPACSTEKIEAKILHGPHMSASLYRIEPPYAWKCTPSFRMDLQKS